MSLRDEVDKLSKAQAIERLRLTHHDLASIKQALRRASAEEKSGLQKPNKNWLLQMERSLIFKKHVARALQDRISRINQEQKARNIAQKTSRELTFERAFIKVAKQLLDRDTYLQLLKAAREASERPSTDDEAQGKDTR